MKPVLVVMAAGLGSRYGGLKQIAPVDEQGCILMDYAAHDARMAGFESIVCVIAPGMEEDFRQVVGDRISSRMDIRYVQQRQDTLPAGFTVPEGRVKPWGTAHAVLSAKGAVRGPFAVVNADDFYGSYGFRQIYDYLVREADDTHHAMVGYRLSNTLTEHGHVARGVCQVDDRDNLLAIVERTHIESRPGGAAFTEDGQAFTFLEPDTVVSMNLWGFDLSMMDAIEERFSAYLAEHLAGNPLKCEYFLPWVPNALVEEGKIAVRVLRTPEKWYGVTYAADMPLVRRAIAEMKREGRYPARLWDAE